MSDLKVEQKQTLSREEAARLIATLAEGLGADGKVTVPMGSSTLELSVAGQVAYELEVTVDGDEIELELELKWSTSGRASEGSAEEESEEDEAEEDEGADDESAAGQAEEDEAEEDEAEEDEAEEDEAEEDEAEEDEAEEDEAEEDEAENIELEAEPERPDSDEEASRPEAVGKAKDRRVPADRTPRPRRGRRSPSAATTQSSSNGVDTAAVRAWAAANGLSVSPRGRIRDEVLQAYRDAGN